MYYPVGNGKYFVGSGVGYGYAYQDGSGHGNGVLGGYGFLFGGGGVGRPLTQNPIQDFTVGYGYMTVHKNTRRRRA